MYHLSDTTTNGVNIMWLILQVFDFLLAGLFLALVWWLLSGRRKSLPGGSNRVIPALVGLLLIFGVFVQRLAGAPIILPFEVPIGVSDWYTNGRFTAPLLLGILGLALLAFHAKQRGRRGAATLTPRTPTSFGRWWWFAVPAVMVVFVLLATVIAGIASSPDPATGRYTMYFVEIGGQRGMGATIYGWYYSVPCLILLAILLALAYLDLFLISRPTLGHDHVRDVYARKVRTRNVLAVTTGALLTHFGLILESLAGTSSLRSEFTGAGGKVNSWTAFAALEPVLSVASFVALGLGVTLWATVLLSATPVGRPAKTVAPS